MSPGKNKAAAKDKNIEVYCPKLVLDAMGIEPLADQERDRMLNWWSADVRPTYERWRQSSCNSDGMLDAVWLLAHPDLAIVGALDGEKPRLIRPVEKWTQWLGWQLGKEAVPPEVPEALAYMHGRETHSNTYAAMVWGAVLAVQWWCEREMRKVGEALEGAKRKPLAEQSDTVLAAPISEVSALLALCREYTLVNCALFALGAASGPAANFQANRRGQFYFNGPWLGQAGQRSTMAHVGQDDRGCMYALALGWPGLVSKREGPWARVARHVLSRPCPTGNECSAIGDLDRTVLNIFVQRGGQQMTEAPSRILERIKTWTPLHFLRWGTGSEQVVVNYTPTRRNRLTGAVMASKAERGEGTVLYPWPPRIRKGGEGGYCYPEQGRIVARSTDDPNTPGKIELSFALPAGPPDFEAVVDENGYRRLR